MSGTSLDEERTEVWTSILEGGPALDADRAAACQYLLRHLVASVVRPARCVRYDGLEPGGVWERQRAPRRHSD